MRHYVVLKVLWVERYKKYFQPGNTVDLDPETGAILAGKGILLEIGEAEAVRRKTKYRRVHDPELDKLDSMEV